MSAYALPHEVDRKGDVPAPGTVLGGAYRVGEPIGNGGLGIVLRGERIANGRTVAIKVLAPAAAADPEQVTRFRREIKASAKIGSDHVVRVLDSGDLESGLPYLVMEHLDGKSLADMAKDAGEPLPIDLVVDWMLEAIDGVAEAHDLGIIHRDIKPANLFLAIESSGGGIVKVLDFGASKLTADSPVDPSDPGGVTVATSLIGSPRYMAPEQIKSALEVDSRADVYGLGAALYELLAGQPIFAGDTLARIFAQVMWEMPEPLVTIRSDVPEGLAAIVMRCLAKEPKDRFETVRDLADALAPYSSLAVAPARTKTVPAPPDPAGADETDASETPAESGAKIVAARAGQLFRAEELPPLPSDADVIVPTEDKPSNATVRMPRFELLPSADQRPQRTVKMNKFVLDAMRAGAGPAPPVVGPAPDAPARERPVAGATVRIQRFEGPRPASRPELPLPMPALIAAIVVLVLVLVALVVVLVTKKTSAHQGQRTSAASTMVAATNTSGIDTAGGQPPG